MADFEFYHGSDVAAGNSVLSFYLIMLCIDAIKCGLKLLNHFFIISFIIYMVFKILF